MIDALLQEKITTRLIDTAPTIPVGVSNRHVHLSQQDVEALFGVGYQLTPFKPLRQPGQFAAEECNGCRPERFSDSRPRTWTGSPDKPAGNLTCRLFYSRH